MERKTKIFVYAHGLGIGGAERALLGLLNSIDYSKYEVDLFLLKYCGDLMEYIPDEVNLLPENKKYRYMMESTVYAVKTGAAGIALGRIYGTLKAEIYNKKHHFNKSLVIYDYLYKYTDKCMPMMSDDEYDLAISFLMPHYYVLSKVNAKKKIAWIHTDYSFYDLNVKSELKVWEKYDNIISISDDVTNAFLSKFPSLKEKIVYIENILSKSFIDEQADLFDVDEEMNSDGLKLLSVGRFDYQKNFENVPEIASIIKHNGIDFKWYLIGFGASEELIRTKIAEFGMEDTVIVLGKKENPYPYMKACDIYIQPSRYEGKAVTVHEAQILQKPIIITDYPTSHSQLTDGFDGVIVPIDNIGCANGIIEVIKNKELLDELKNNLRKINYSNEDEINKLYSLIGD